jgi:hypothetical protein
MSATKDKVTGGRPVTGEEPAPWGARHRRRPEDAIQRAVFQHLRARGAPGLFAFHPPNGGYRRPVEAAILKGMGVVAGVPDIIELEADRTAPKATVDALMFSLRRGINELTQPSTLERLSQLDERQLSEVAERVQNFRQAIASAWTPDEVKALVRIWGQSHE